MDSILFVAVSALVGIAVGRFNVVCWVKRDRVWAWISSFALVGPLVLMGSLPLAPIAGFVIGAVVTVAVSISLPEPRDDRDSFDTSPLSDSRED